MNFVPKEVSKKTMQRIIDERIQIIEKQREEHRKKHYKQDKELE